MKEIKHEWIQIKLEVADIEKALSEHFGKEIKIGEVDAEVFINDDWNSLDFLEFSVDGEEEVRDYDLWEDMLEESLHQINTSQMENDWILEEIFDFDARTTFRSVGVDLS